MTSPRPDVSVITVSYQCLDELEGLLDSLARCPSERTLEIHVADNASTDGTEETVRGQYPEVDFVQVGYNSGFSTANNVGIARSRGRYLFLLNPDTRVTEGCIDTLVAFMDENPEVSAVGPKLLNRDKTLQYSIRNLPTLRGSLLEAFFLHRAFPRLLAHHGEMIFDESAYETAHPVGWLSGAAMFVRRSVMDSVGPLDESFFLFSEEIDWFKRMHDAGLAVWFCPDAVVVHRDDKGVPNPRMMAIDIDSRHRYWRKHASAPRAAAAMGILGFNRALRFVLWSVLAIGRGEKALDRRASYAMALRAFAPGGRPPRPTPPVAEANATPLSEGG